MGTRGSLAAGSRLDYNAVCALRPQLGVNVRVGRLAGGRIGRQRTIAVVALTAHLVGGEPCQPIATVTSRARTESSGTSLTGELNVKVISAGGRINMSGEEYQKTTIGKATVEAVAQLVRELEGRYETVSFKVESECSYAGVSGVKGAWREGGQSRWEICASPQVALPLAVILRDEGGELYR